MFLAVGCRLSAQAKITGTFEQFLPWGGGKKKDTDTDTDTDRHRHRHSLVFLIFFFS